MLHLYAAPSHPNEKGRHVERNGIRHISQIGQSAQKLVLQISLLLQLVFRVMLHKRLPIPLFGGRLWRVKCLLNFEAVSGLSRRLHT